jgi:hypothetical protein
MPDPLAGLAEKTAADPGAPFMPEALEALAALRQNNRAAFEALRSQLKKAGCRVTALDDAIAEENGTPSGRGPTQADMDRVQDKPIGATVQHLRVGGVETLLVPLPPLAEQHRIVAKVDTLMALCDRLEASLTATASSRRRLLDALLAEALAPAEDRELEAAE